MSIVKITFKYEGSDDEDSTGLSEHEFNELNEQVAALGGYDIEFDRVEPTP